MHPKGESPWLSGVIDGHYFDTAVYWAPSETFGINDGPVSKLWIYKGPTKKSDELIFEYDREHSDLKKVYPEDPVIQNIVKKLTKYREKDPEYMKECIHEDSVQEYFTVTTYISYLEKTLIPDLKESGKTATAEDFETLVYVLRHHKLPQQDLRTWSNVDDFVGYLEETLIPDLKESGSDAMAEDFEQGVEFIKETI
jgi:hypothetical protein